MYFSIRVTDSVLRFYCNFDTYSSFVHLSFHVQDDVSWTALLYVGDTSWSTKTFDRLHWRTVDNSHSRTRTDFVSGSCRIYRYNKVSNDVEIRSAEYLNLRNFSWQVVRDEEIRRLFKPKLVPGREKFQREISTFYSSKRMNIHCNWIC